MFISSNRGISLLTVAIMIGILSISLMVTRLLLYQQTGAPRESETRKAVKGIYEAIMGSPETGIFGYVSDMGGPPASLNDLGVNPGTSSAFTGTNGVKMGWNGPYVNAGLGLESYKKDAWRNDYAMVGIGQIRSNGSDGMADTSDDIVFPSKPLNSFNGSLVLKVPKGGILCEIADIKEIIVYYSEEGIEKSKSLGAEDFKLSDTDGFYITEPIPLHHGIHAVKVSDIFNKTVFANVAVFAESTNTQIVGTLPYEGINLHPQFPPHISLDDNRAVELNIVNATGCQEGDGVSYDISRIDIAEIGGMEDYYLLEISFNEKVVFVENTGIPISHDIENPTSVTLSEMYSLQPGMSLNKLKFLNAAALDTSFVLTYHYTDTEEPGALKNSTISFRLAPD